MIAVSNNIKPIDARLNRCHPLSRGLKGYWDFNHPGKASDLSGNGIDLTLRTTENNYTTSVVGPAYHATGGIATSYDSIFTHDEMTFLLGFSYQVDGTFKTLIESRGVGPTPVSFRVSSSISTLQFIQREASGGNRSVTGENFALDTYYLMVIRFEQYPGIIDMWRDGEVIANGSASIFAPQYSTDTIIGLGASRYIDISVMAIWDRSLTDSEVVEVSADPFSIVRQPLPWYAYPPVPAIPEATGYWLDAADMFTPGAACNDIYSPGPASSQLYTPGSEIGEISHG
ncbi:hypothetical protein HED60_19415 [Planctomycetales bacterium ZRK34]|nr:hypothetical protein HED60_19415 [Planctomycetales bacterium ZRK34]